MNDRRVSLSRHHGASGNIVDEPPYDVPERTKNKLYLALGFMILLKYILYTVVRPLGLPPSYDDLEPTHDLTLWAEPTNDTYYVSLEFYVTQQDALGEHNILARRTIQVRPDMTNMTEYSIYALPQAPRSFWVRVVHAIHREVPGPDGDLYDRVYSVHLLRIGELLTVHLGDHEFSILVTPVQTE